MSEKEWIATNFSINEDKEIEWDESTRTPVETFISFFGVTINDALDDNDNVVQAILNSDKEDKKGFHKCLKRYL